MQLQAQGRCSLQQWQSRLSYYVYETVGQLRIKEMFDIVVDYPESRPAVQDVKECLAHTNLHRRFVAGFKEAIRERLLHAGLSMFIHLLMFGFRQACIAAFWRLSGRG